MDMLDLKGVTLQELRESVEAYGEPRFRASQILDWLYNSRIQHRVDRLQCMPNLSKACIEKLQPITYITSLILQETDDSRYVFIAQDNNPLHAFLKKERLFLATQIGCSYKCKFCPYSRIGFIRNLAAGEIVDQAVKIQAKNQAIKEIALGGMGEPLANYDAVLNAIKIINGQWGLGFSFKNIYLYTCGIAPKIKELADTKLPIRLIVGLHSVDDKTRSSLMGGYPVDTLLNAVKYYGHKTGILVELEYMLFDGVNDSYQDAKDLIKKLLGLPVRLALITYEPVSRVRLKPVNQNRQEEFLNTLLSGNIKAEIK